MCVCLCEKGRTVNKRVNRLVALAFIPNPNNYPDVGHDDDNKTNNHISNLYWTTKAENNLHNDKHRRKCRPVLCVETGEVFDSLTDAAAAIDVNSGNIVSAIKRKGTCHGYHWEYAEKI